VETFYTELVPNILRNMNLTGTKSFGGSRNLKQFIFAKLKVPEKNFIKSLILTSLKTRQII
jgi:hypothetical protein